ncbi:hypothetical protein [Paenarthrobacter ureafaciens]|uniref:hypothetical protein n=1 Tax=Paenarthrobacter ureafaciens TaxID=37931 RepID=UPI00140BC07B|nr:hypothetical protein [Paenarthrobacter ureafaciens]MCX8453704.1 hypothetical protein [Paenarthrobacter ureafaciens]MCY0973363.1 hypothetical protein [Paenarthrobacter ureafaciens]
MTYHRSDIAKFATIASLALSLTLTGCSSETPEASPAITGAASEELAVAQSPSPAQAEAIPSSNTQAARPSPADVPIAVVPVIQTPIPLPAVTKTPAAPAPPMTTPPKETGVTPITPVVPSTPHVSPDYPQSGTFTFPDGHISFELPAGWSVQVEQGNYNELANLPGGKENCLIANVYNAIGENVARIDSGATFGVVGGPVNRTIINSQQLTQFDSRDGASHFAFFRDEYPFEPTVTRYFMGVVNEKFMTEGPDSISANSFLGMGNGAAQAVAHIDVNMTPRTAATWMETEQYANLRALLTSLRYTA